MIDIGSQTFIKSVLQTNAVQAEDSSLALPLEENIILSTNPISGKTSRVQQQVQLTLSRKSKKGLSNGSLHLPGISETLYKSEYGKDALNMLEKVHLTEGYETNYESLSKSASAGYRLTDTMSRPAMRLEVSPFVIPEMQRSQFGFRSSYHDGMFHGGGAYTMPVAQAFTKSASQRDKERSRSLSCRYAHSEIVNGRKFAMARAPTFQRSQRQVVTKQRFSSDDGVFLPSSPISPDSSMPVFVDAGRAGVSMRQQARFGNSFQTNRSSEGGLWKYGLVRRESGFKQNANRASYPASLISMEIDGRRASEARGFSTMDQQKSVRELKRSKSEGQAIELTLDKAVGFLSQENTDFQVSAANFIQHQCYLSSEAKRTVFFMHGIPKLINLLKSDSVELQRAASGALRNIVFENNDNKMDVKEQNGIPVVLKVLKTTRDMETKKQLTGLLWNLSSHDLLKDQLSREALQIVTDTIIVPCSGLSDGDYPKDDLLADPEIFYNATGCLRNLSSAGPEGRKAMRDCDSFIDSLVHYVRGSVADRKPDDKSAENCVCVLHNLSYQLEAEHPHKFSREIRESRQNLAIQREALGCFGSRSTKITVTKESSLPFPEEKSNPRGVEWLWSPITVRMYLSLIAMSNRKFSQEASLGALQNLTSGKGMLPYAIAHTIVQKENGLQHIKKMIQADGDVKKATVSLLRNLSRYSELHKEMGAQLLPDLLLLLPNSGTSTDVTADMTVSVCYVLNNLVQKDSQNARAILSSGGLNKIFNISTKETTYGPTKAAIAASNVLHSMWRHTELHSLYKKAGYKKTDFINNGIIKAVKSTRD
ncbi:plakophilin-2 [Amia ocellicauda]|uniref:plakophilin-2 n=1 Tax=Amia ocellicauda TaxID=2972642 RepID=UPI003464C1F9|nr:PKP2 protein [Amia calva]